MYKPLCILYVSLITAIGYTTNKQLLFWWYCCIWWYAFEMS